MLEQIGRPTRDQAASRALGAALVVVAALFLLAELLSSVGVASGAVALMVALGMVAAVWSLVRSVRQS